MMAPPIQVLVLQGVLEKVQGTSDRQFLAGLILLAIAACFLYMLIPKGKGDV